MITHPTLIVFNAKIHTGVAHRPEAQALAVTGRRIAAVGSNGQIRSLAGPATVVIDAGRRRIIPGLIDSHLRLIRGGLTYNLELRWDGVPSLADAMRMLADQAGRTPPPQWVHVVGGFSEYQFAERRLPTLDELNRVAPSTPVFVQHLHDRALLNAAALRACGYTRDTPDPPGGHIEWDDTGSPTGLLVATPNPATLQAALACAPSLPYEYQINATRQLMRNLNRRGVTSVIDAGGNFQSYPDDYRAMEELHQHHLLTVRVAYHLSAQRAGEELQDFRHWSSLNHYGEGDDFYRLNGAGELLVFSAADFSDFRQPRPELPPLMESELEQVARLLATRSWPWRMHATYDETISRSLDVFEKVNKDIPLQGLNWFFDHAETISERSIDRIAALGGGIAVQHRMAYQGEYFVERYGAAAAQATPPVARMLEKGVKVSAGTDATRVASYNPWVSLAWLITGKTVGGLGLYPRRNCLDRETALRMWTEYVTWFSNEEGKKGRIAEGQLADLVVPDRDFFGCPEDDIADTTSLLTIVGGRVVYGSGEFSSLDDVDVPAAMPEWSPVRTYGGYGAWAQPRVAPAAPVACGCAQACGVHGHDHVGAWASKLPVSDLKSFWGALGCACWAI